MANHLKDGQDFEEEVEQILGKEVYLSKFQMYAVIKSQKADLVIHQNSLAKPRIKKVIESEPEKVLHVSCHLNRQFNSMTRF